MPSVRLWRGSNGKTKEMTPTRFLLLCTVAWLATAVATIVIHLNRRRVNAGLVVAYIANFALLYWLGAVPYGIQGVYHGHEEAMLAAMPISCVAVFAFAIGNIGLAPAFASRKTPVVRAVAPVDDVRIALVYFAAGAMFYSLLWTRIHSIPSINSVIAGGENLIVAGVCLACWTAWNRRHELSFWAWLGLTLVFPVISTLAQGMMGVGVTVVLLVFAFAMSFYRPRWKMAVLGLVLSYFGLAIYNSYMRDRSDIRRVVWGGASAMDRVEKVLQTVSSLEPVDLHNDRLLFRVDERLNQDVLLGIAVNYMAETGKSAHGATLADAMLAIIPRAFWVNKPIRAGSGDIVSEYTGITFAEGTSVGVGQVLELYINFGTLGVAIGFLVLGTILTLIDWRAGEHLYLGRWRSFVFWFLLGAPIILLVGGAFVEVTGTMAGSAVVAWLVNHLLITAKRGQRAAPLEPAALMAIAHARTE